MITLKVKFQTKKMMSYEELDPFQINKQINVNKVQVSENDCLTSKTCLAGYSTYDSSHHGPSFHAENFTELRSKTFIHAADEVCKFERSIELA